MSGARQSDWLIVAHHAARPVGEGGLSDEEGAALEGRILADETDVEARVRLVGFYYLRLSPEHHRRRAGHLAWLAEHRSDVALGGYGLIDAAKAPEGHEATRRAWIAAAARPEADVRTLDNAATFLGFYRPEDAEPLLRRAAAIEPDNEQWRARIASILMKRAELADTADERRRDARAAVEELERALALSHEDWTRLGIRIDLATAAVVAEDWDRARDSAERVLAENETCTRTFLYGNAIHWANIALGWAALKHDRVTAASDFLRRAGKTPGSPQLDSFGPDRDLARALLERGEQAAVLAYLADCARFWEGNEGVVEGWCAAIRRGDPTNLEEPDDADEA